MPEKITLPPDFKQRVLTALSNDSNINALLDIDSSLIIKLIECHLGQIDIVVSPEKMLRIIKNRPADKSLIDAVVKEATQKIELISLRDRYYQIAKELQRQKFSVAI